MSIFPEEPDSQVPFYPIPGFVRQLGRYRRFNDAWDSLHGNHIEEQNLGSPDLSLQQRQMSNPYIVRPPLFPSFPWTPLDVDISFCGL
jgi:hypothetical protein